MHDEASSTPVTGSRRSRSYLLRVWQEEQGSPWRSLLRSVTTKEEHVFPDLERLVTFLQAGAGAGQARGDKDEG